MFVTNFPVDNHSKFGGWTMEKMFDVFSDVVKDLNPEEQSCLWKDTALKVYKMKL